eukprot:6214105-Pleurochrysis_carterae.AAC.6
MGRSPIAVHLWGRQSIPATRSWHAQMLTRRLPLRAELRQARVAIMARAHVAIEADMRQRGNGRHAVGQRCEAREKPRRHVNNASGAAIVESMISLCDAKSASSARRPPCRAAAEEGTITRHASVMAAVHAGSKSRREASDTSAGFEHSGNLARDVQESSTCLSVQASNSPLRRVSGILRAN